ncbi:MAG: aquaporin, partial [Flavobacteriales bacterium]|nr:aquaporin [Flavobacteriales bacterium]
GAAVILGWLSSLWQVALVWGIGVTLAIKICDRWCPAHLNPAVTLGMCLARHHSWRRLFPYALAQLTGAVLAAFSLLQLFKSPIESMEKANLGTDADLYHFVAPLRSQESAQMFGEFFPNPSYAHLIDIDWPTAFLVEFIGTGLLIYFILMITEGISRLTWKVAASIGLLVASLIAVLAPFTQCGINPARDLGPRLVAYFNGWGEYALPDPAHAAISVYVLAPLLGAMLAAWSYSRYRVNPK